MNYSDTANCAYSPLPDLPDRIAVLILFSFIGEPYFCNHEGAKVHLANQLIGKNSCLQCYCKVHTFIWNATHYILYITAITNSLLASCRKEIGCNVFSKLQNLNLHVLI